MQTREKMGRKRNLRTLVNDAAAGITMTLGGMVILETVYEAGQQLGPKLQEYVGSLGSGIIAFGMPTIYLASIVPIIYKTVKALDRVQLENQTD